AHPPRASEVEDARDMCEEAVEIRPGGEPTREADLRETDARYHPSDVAGCEVRVEEDMESLLDVLHALELRLHPREERMVQSEAGAPRDTGSRSIGTDEHASGSRAGEARAAAKLGPCLRSPFGQRSQQRRWIRSQELVAGRIEIDPPQRGSVEAHAVDAPGGSRRRILFLRSLLHEEAGRM